MSPRPWWCAAVLALAACSGSPTPDGGTAGGGAEAGGAGGGGGAVAGGGGGGGGGGGPAECALPQNVQHADALLAAQPALSARSRQLLTVQYPFASRAGDPGVTCTVELRFKDSNGDGALTDYEDWTKTAAERSAALLARLGPAQKEALLAHGEALDVPAGTSPAPSAAVQAMIDSGLRFARTGAATAQLTARAAWANAIQERCESQPLGIPFVLSMEPSHSSGSGRVKARGFSQWPHEQGLAAGSDLAAIEAFGRTVSQEYRAIGVRMALSPSADLYTDPRWHLGQFGYGEDSSLAAQRVAAYVRGAQGETLGQKSVACVVGRFPGAGAAKGGWDARLAKGRWLSYAGGAFDAHAQAFQAAFAAKVAAVMPALGVPERGPWSGLGGLVDGATVEQVGVPFNAGLLGLLRGHHQFQGLVLAPAGALDTAAWGFESASAAQRAAAAVNAGVDQLAGLDSAAPISQAHASGLISDAVLDRAARHALELVFALGLFEDPYVDAAQAPALCNTDPAYRAGLNAMNAGMVLLHNAPKPAGWLNGNGDGTQTGDKGNAGNGSLKVLPAPPGEPYVSAGCSYYIMGNFDLDYVRSVSTGYGELTNDATSIKGVPVSTAAQRIALSDYVFIRIEAPFTADPDGLGLGLPLQSLEYAPNDNRAQLDDLAFARAAIDAQAGSKAQIVVGVDLGRPSVVSEIMSYAPSGLYVQWAGVMPGNPYADKVFLDVAFGIVHGTGKLPTGLPLSDLAATEQKCDLAGDGQHPTYVKGYGLQTQRFE